ncbi:MAG: VCBS repeat-containing protein [Myxococcota bacterium]
MSRLGFFACVLLAAGPADGAGFKGQTLTVPGNVGWLTHGDLDGDGAEDLVLSYVRGGGPGAQRNLAIFFRKDGGWGLRPDLTYRAPDVAAVFDLGDALPSPGLELLYWTPTGVYAQDFVNRKPTAPKALVKVETLVGPAERDELVQWDFMRVEPGQEKAWLLLLPDPRRVHVFRKRDQAWTEVATPIVDSPHLYDAESEVFRPSDDGGGYGNYAMRVLTLVPQLRLVDQTGDGRPDLVAHFEDQVEVHVGLPDGGFEEKARHRRFFALRSEEEHRTGEAFVQSYVRDFDGDGIADFCVRKNAGGLVQATSSILFFRGLRGGGFTETPVQVVESKGVASVVDFRDVDGDGRLELLTPRVRLSILAFIRAFTSRSLSVEVDILPGLGRSQTAFFADSPRQTLEFTLGLSFEGGFGVEGTPPLFGHDFDQDGHLDVLMSDGAERMVLHRGLAGEAEPFQKDGFIQLSGATSPTTLVLAPRVGAKPEVVVFYVGRKAQADELLWFRNDLTED